MCELAKVPGRFLPDKALELGVPRGQLFAALKSGKSVTLEDGRVIEPHLVSNRWLAKPTFCLVTRLRQNGSAKALYFGISVANVRFLSCTCPAYLLP